jgi:hypothetical protein
MVVTIQLVADGDSTEHVEITSAVDVVPSRQDAAHVANVVAERARDAALQLVEHGFARPAVAADGFVPLARLLRRADDV